jgi:hypothetical protein
MVDSPHVPDVIGQVVSRRTSGAGAVVTAPLTDRRCLNCGAALHGAFCGECGQRSVPANPTVSELAGDAWQELSGYDGRILATFRGLLHPGRLTNEYLQGRRARYLPPVRLYLIASVIYFVIAAAVPESKASGIQIGVTQTGRDRGAILTEQDRAEMIKGAEDAPWFTRAMIRSAAADPEGFRARIFTLMPRVFFGLLPVFAGILALFYRGRRFPVSLVFAAHAHAAAFLIFAVSAIARLTRTESVEVTVALVCMAAFATYALMALRAVFGGSWPGTVAKAVAIGFLYLLASAPAFFILLIWAALV